MKVSREESFIGDTSIKIYEKMKSWGKSTHPVGALIPPKQSYEWDRLRNRFEKYGVNMSKGGLLFSVKWTNIIMDATCPIAEETGYNPVGLTDDLVNMFAELIKDIDKEKWIAQSSDIRNEIVEETKNKISLKIKNILVK